MELTEGIWRVDGVRVSNAYLADTGDGLMLVDTGMPGSAKAIAAFVRGLGRKLSDVRWIVITHCDLDHIGSVAEVKALTGGKVAIHSLDAEVLSTGRPRKGGALLTVFFKVLRYRPVEPDRLLKDGDSIGGFRVVHTPGHTAGSITLVRDGVVICGDALLGDKEGHVRPPTPSLAADPKQAAETAKRIEAMGAKLLLPGHGAPARAG